MEAKLSVIFLVVTCLIGFTISITYDESLEPVYMQDVVNTIHCLNKNVSDPYGMVYSHEGVEKEPYAAGRDCLLTINTKPGNRINLRFEYFDMERNFDIPLNRCRNTGDRLMIYEADTSRMKDGSLLPDRTLCGGTGLFPEDYQSAGSTINVRFITDTDVTENKGVKLLYSAFVPPGEETPACFLCSDESMCIDSSLKCNGVPNCNDDSDERESLCSPDNLFEMVLSELGGTMVAVIGSAIIVLVVILLILCICCCCCCCCRKKGDGHEQKQYRSPPVPRPAAYPPQNPTPSNYSSYSESMPNHHRPYPNYPSGYPPVQNGYSVAYNHENGRMQFPHQV